MRVLGLAVLTLLVGCKSSTGDSCPTPDAGPVTPPLAAQGTEWVNYHSEVPITPVDLDKLMSGMFGADAKAGTFVTQKEIAKAFYVTSQAETSTPDQVRLTFSFDDGSGTPRVLAATPGSFTVGKIFIATVDAAIAQMQTDVTAKNAGGEIFNLTYQVASANGGTLGFTVNGTEGTYTLALDVTTPHTSLKAGNVGLAVSTDGPNDLVAGTVWFDMQKDEFDYFTNHAYGEGATSGQNFTDFALVPYLWLRLSVTPQLEQNLVNVSFEVLNPDNTRIALAKAPASVMAGGTFQHLVDRQMSNMLAQEAAQVGSSTPWEVPFYYDQPTGGGVVQVIAKGAKGGFKVAYTVASPQHPLVDVPFVPYKAVMLPPPDPNAKKACYQLGLPGVTQSLVGVFDVTFTASQVIKDSLPDGGTLKGDIGCSIYRASDVSVTGPNAGAVTAEDFTVPMADLLATTPTTFTTKNMLPDGAYQILCAQYVDGNTAKVSKGDPVTLPIGGFTIACNTNPAAVEFAILNPSDH